MKKPGKPRTIHLDENSLTKKAYASFHQRQNQRSSRFFYSIIGTFLAILGGTCFLPDQGPDLRATNVMPSLDQSRPGQPVARTSSVSALVAEASGNNISLPTTQIRIDGQAIEVIADVALVKPGADTSSARRFLDAIGSRVLHQSPTGYWRVSCPEGLELVSFLEQLEAQDVFTAVQPEGLVRACSDPTGGAYVEYQWNLEQIGWEDLVDNEDVLLEDLAGVTIAVIDSGLAYETRIDGDTGYVASPDLFQSEIVPGPDFVDQDGHPNDRSGHGTHVTNVIAAFGGTVGVAPFVKLMPIRILDEANMGTELALADALLYAVEQDVDIINLSLSFPPGYIPGSALAEAVQAAVDANIVLVAATGNEGATSVSYPAAFADVIAVGANRLAASEHDWVADYSNTGAGMDLVAPGGTIDLDVNEDDVPDGIVAQTFEPGNPSDLGYYVMAGTSQAVAHVSGAAAWLRAAGATPEETRQAFVDTATPTWGQASYSTLEGTATLEAAKALEAYEEGGYSLPDSPLYVDVLATLSAEDGHHGAVGLIRVIDDKGKPAKKVLLAGRWFGSVEASFAVVTNKDGEATAAIVSDIDVTSPAFFGLQVDRAFDHKNHAAPVPIPYYYLSQGLNAAIDAWYADGRAAGANLIFSVNPGAYGAPESSPPSYVTKPIGPIDGFAPISFAFTADYIPALEAPQPENTVAIFADFEQPQAFGWGLETSAELLVVNDVPLADGTTATFAITPLDFATYYPELAPVVPILNESTDLFLEANYANLGQLASDPEFAAMAEAVLGAGAMSSIVADGAMAGLIGDGALSSLIGDGAMASLIGDAALSSLIGDGAMAGLIGDGALSGLIGDVKIFTVGGECAFVQLAGSSVSVPLMVPSSYQDDPSEDPISINADFSPVQDFVYKTPNKL